MSNQVTQPTPLMQERVVSANSLRDSPWLKGPSFLRTHDWPFKPPKHVEIKLKAKRSDFLNSDEETSEILTALSATVIGIATTFEWQKYSSYEKLLRVLAYILRLLLKNEGYRSDFGFVTDPNEIRNAEMTFLSHPTSHFPSNWSAWWNNPPSATLPNFLNSPLSLGLKAYCEQPAGPNN